MFSVMGQVVNNFGEGNDNPLQYSCLENPMERGVWQATVHGVTKTRTQLSDFTFTFGVFLGITCKSGIDDKTDKILQITKIDCFFSIFQSKRTCGI